MLFFNRPTYYGGLYILLGTDIYLPPHLPVIHDDVNCQLNNLQAPMTLFAFRAHTHKHGTSVTGYLYRKNVTTEIARGNPHQPQMFYPMLNDITVNNGDVLAARCTFNTTQEDTQINIGKSKHEINLNIWNL